MKRTRTIEATKKILGIEVFNAMYTNRIGITTIINAAALNAFKNNLQGQDVDDLRIGLVALHDEGILID